MYKDTGDAKAKAMKRTQRYLCFNVSESHAQAILALQTPIPPQLLRQQVCDSWHQNLCQAGLHSIPPAFWVSGFILACQATMAQLNTPAEHTLTVSFSLSLPVLKAVLMCQTAPAVGNVPKTKQTVWIAIYLILSNT